MKFMDEAAIGSLTENLQEAPETDSAEDGDCEVIVPAPEVDQLAPSSHHAGHGAHDAQGKGAGNSSGSRPRLPSEKAANTIGE